MKGVQTLVVLWYTVYIQHTSFKSQTHEQY